MVKLKQAKPFNPAMSDRDILIRIDERQTVFEKKLDSHLAHHWAMTLAAITAVLGAVAMYAIAVIF